MKVHVNTAMLEIDGKEVKDGETTLSLADCLIKALLTPHKDDETASAETKLKLWTMAQRVQEARGGEILFTLEDAVFVKERVNKIFISPVIIGNVHSIFEKASS